MNPIALKSKESWLAHHQTVGALQKDAVDKHKRIVQDLQQLADAVNTPPSSIAGNLLPILHPADSTTGIFPIDGPGMQFVVGGVVQMTITAEGVTTP